jgi:hypothetical protein
MHAPANPRPCRSDKRRSRGAAADRAPRTWSSRHVLSLELDRALRTQKIAVVEIGLNRCAATTRCS